MFYPRKVDDIKMSLSLKIENERQLLEGFKFLKLAIMAYKRKTIDGYLSNHIETTSPKYQVTWQIWNSQTRKDEPIKKEFEVYSLKVDKQSYGKYLNFYIHLSDPLINCSNKTNKEIFYLKDFTIIELAEHLQKKIEHTENNMRKLGDDLKNIDTIYKNHCHLMAELDKLETSLNYYTMDALTKNQYQLKDNSYKK